MIDWIALLYMSSGVIFAVIGVAVVWYLNRDLLRPQPPSDKHTPAE